jgi:hemerythrin-like domain-containing protein
MKRRAELHGLSDDHHTALIVALRCRRAAAQQGNLSLDEAWGQAQRLAHDQLRAHFLVEENLLLPALVELGEQAMAARIAEEHRSLERLLEISDPGDAHVAEFAELLDDHIRFEERVVFEQTQDRLPQEVLDAVQEAAPHDRSCSIS